MNIIHAKQLLTVRGAYRARRGAELRNLEIIEDGAVAMRDGRIDWVGPTDQLPDRTGEQYDATGKIVLPGFVDSHTHSVFVGTRADEFEWRIEGTPYMEILARGGGILSSTRALCGTADLRVRFSERFLEYGTTSIEAKSGYGLSLEHEIRMLEAMKMERTLDVIPTFMGAHVLPEDYLHRRTEFVERVIEKDLRAIASRNLAEFCDVFVEPGAFSTEEAARIFSAATRLGFGIKIHADEFVSSGGAELAVKAGAVSADHLGAVTEEGIRQLAASDVVATLLPSTLFMLGHTRYAPARELIDAGCAVALATDFNPGTSPTLNMQFVLSLACTQMRMTPAEAVVGATINGAAAVKRAQSLGSIEAGKQADIAIYDVSDYREIPYFAAVNFCIATFKRGVLMYEANR